jgi:tRNA nucleotidyltransferase (CCA-adding enzyme)
MRSENINDLLARLQNSKGKGDKSPLLTRAISLLESVVHEGTPSGDVLSSLLTDVLKPLFASTPNPNLTPAGRKNLVSAPPTTGRFDTPFLERERKPWKEASWSVDVLRFIVTQYNSLRASSRKEVIETQFYLLVPPILTLIDDGDVSSKTSGCELLSALCNTILASKSTMLSRSGLADVFADSLKANFMLLPTLTPENESLTLLRQLYPAFRALVSATYAAEQLSTSIKDGHTGPTLFKSSAAGDNRSYPYRDARQKMLDAILRHGILASYNHASDYVAIAEFLVHEAVLVISDMRINAVKYLSRLLPLLRSILTNPLGAAYPPLLEVACDLLTMLVTNCKPRIASTWWVECLRMCVGCWFIIRIDLRGSTAVQTKLGNVVQKLRDVVGDERFREAADTLMRADEELKDMLYPA